MNLDDNTIVQDSKVQDKPIGCNCNVPLPNGVTVLDCAGGLRPWPCSATRGSDRARGELRPSMTIVVVFLPPRLSVAARCPLFQNFRHFTTPDNEQQETALPTGARIKQEEQQTIDKEAGIKPRKIPRRLKMVTTIAARTGMALDVGHISLMFFWTLTMMLMGKSSWYYQRGYLRTHMLMCFP
eukprot:3081708-Pyramimonas_sp.AAC.1